MKQGLVTSFRWASASSAVLHLVAHSGQVAPPPPSPSPPWWTSQPKPTPTATAADWQSEQQQQHHQQQQSAFAFARVASRFQTRELLSDSCVHLARTAAFFQVIQEAPNVGLVCIPSVITSRPAKIINSCRAGTGFQQCPQACFLPRTCCHVVRLHAVLGRCVDPGASRQ